MLFYYIEIITEIVYIFPMHIPSLVKRCTVMVNKIKQWLAIVYGLDLALHDYNWKGSADQPRWEILN